MSKHRLWAGLILGHPLLIAAAFVLDRFTHTNSVAEEVTRPLVVAVALAFCLLILALAVLRHPVWAPLAASVAFLALAAHLVPLLVLLVLATWWLVIGRIRRRRDQASLPLTERDAPGRIAAAYSIGLLLVGGSSLAMAPSVPQQDLGCFVASGAVAERPDILLLVLDGYPRGDTIRREFGSDNREFEVALDRLGFQISPAARTNYDKPWLTMGSLLSGRYVHDRPPLSDPPADGPSQSRLAHEAIEAAPVLTTLREAGYRVVSIPSLAKTTDVLSDAEVLQPPHLNSLEISIVSSSLLAYALPGPTLQLLSDQVRGYLGDQVTMLAAQGPPDDHPRLILAHLMSPHPPFVLDQDATYLAECFPACKIWATTVRETFMASAEYQSRMRVQLDELNRLVVGSLSAFVEANPTALVIVMSDHGARHRAENPAATDEHFRALFAARVPDHAGQFPPDISPVNVFRRLGPLLFGQSMPDVEYEAWTSDWNLPLVLSEFP